MTGTAACHTHTVPMDMLYTHKRLFKREESAPEVEAHDVPAVGVAVHHGLPRLHRRLLIVLALRCMDRAGRLVGG